MNLQENDQNIINKSGELQKVQCCIETSKIHDIEINNIERVFTTCTEIHVSQNNAENLNEQYNSANCVRNGSHIQDLIQKENNLFIDFNNKANNSASENAVIPNEKLDVSIEDCKKKIYTTQNSNSVEEETEMPFQDLRIYDAVVQNEIKNNLMDNEKLQSNKENINKDSDNVSKLRKKAKRIIDSDSETDDLISHQGKSNFYKRQTVFDSDSDEEVTPFSNDLEPINQAQIYSLDDKGKLIAESDISSRVLAICDLESSDEDKSDNYDHSKKVIETKVNSENKKLKGIFNNEDKKITGRDASKLRKEITSESQRMTRECAVNLPYHKPKVRTLKEFLQNRPRFAATVPTSTSNRPPSLAIKMLSEHLELISEKLSEREKKVEEFFKSESESEEEETDYVNNKFNEKNVNIESDISKKSEDYYKKDIENLNNETVEQNVNTNDKLLEQNENVNKPTNESTVVILQNFVLNSGTGDEIELDKIYQSENLGGTDQIQQTTLSTSEIKIFDQDATETQIQQAITQPNEDDTFKNYAPNSPQFEFSMNDVSSETATQIQQTITQPNTDNTLQNCEPNSPQFEFSMDDVSSDTEENEKAHNLETNKLIEKYTLEEFPSEITNISANKEQYNKYDNEHNKKDIFNDQQFEKKTQLNMVKELSNIKPELKGSPGLVIDLEDGSTKLSEVSQLMNRFLKHNKKKTPQKNKVKLDIVSLTGGEIRKETIELPRDDEETIAINEKPGERLKKLRSELETQMAQRRSQLWREKSNMKIKSEKCEATNEPHIENEIGNDLLDDENEEEFTDSEEEEEEEEEDDDNEIEEKPNKNSVFLDEEAEESDLDNNDKNSRNDENSIDNTEICHDHGAYNNDESNQLLQENYEIQPKKKLKRIIKPFSNDSDDEDSSLDNDIDLNIEKIAINNEKNQECILDSTDTCDDSVPTPHQQRNYITPSKRQSQSKSELGFLTPVVQLTGLQSLNSGSKFLHESPVSPFIIPVDSPIKSVKESRTQKRLFTDTDLATTQELSEVAELCSGKFLSQTQEANGTKALENTYKDDNNTACNDNLKRAFLTSQTEPSTQDLLEICSGKFTGFTQSVETNTNEERDENNKIASTSIIDNSKPKLYFTEISISNNEIKNLDAEDKLISQLLDEEEMENFKKKFDSPLNEKDSSPSSFPRKIYDSSDDENTFSEQRRKQRKLIFSDDENSSCDQEETIDCEKEIDLCDNIDEDEELAYDNTVGDVEYDSEENEIEVNIEDKRKKMKIADFVEKEAELSESEWDSADEDERGLDELEIEEGDQDKFDENKVKIDLERIHM